MSVKSRLQRLERRKNGPVKWVFLWQDDSDPELFHGPIGTDLHLREGDPNWPENCLRVVYDRNWKSEQS